MDPHNISKNPLFDDFMIEIHFSENENKNHISQTIETKKI